MCIVLLWLCMRFWWVVNFLSIWFWGIFCWVYFLDGGLCWIWNLIVLGIFLYLFNGVGLLILSCVFCFLRFVVCYFIVREWFFVIFFYYYLYVLMNMMLRYCYFVLVLNGVFRRVLRIIYFWKFIVMLFLIFCVKFRRV